MLRTLSLNPEVSSIVSKAVSNALAQEFPLDAKGLGALAAIGGTNYWLRDLVRLTLRDGRSAIAVETDTQGAKVLFVEHESASLTQIKESEIASCRFERTAFASMPDEDLTVVMTAVYEVAARCMIQEVTSRSV